MAKPNTPSARTLLALDDEISKKESYNPHGAEAAYRDRLFAQFAFAFQQATGTKRELNDRSPLAYFTRNEEDSFSYVPPPEDPNDWHSRMTWGEMRQKFEALQSFLMDLSFKVEPDCRDHLGKTDLAASDAAEALLAHADLMDGCDDKNFYATHDLFKHGTVFENVAWERRYAVEKVGRDWKGDEDGMELPAYSEKDALAFEGVATETLKPNRVYLANYAEPDISKQPYIFIDYVLPYLEARTLFGKWVNWKYVKPTDPSEDGWTDSEIDQQNETDEKYDRVRVRVFKCLPQDEYAICCNRVLMTPPGLKLPEPGTYGVTLTQAGVFDPHFALGRSFLASMRPHALMGDVLRNALVNKARQLTDPPLQSKFRVMLSKYVSRPGTVIAAQGGSLEELFPTNGAAGQFLFEAVKIIEQSIDKNSVSQVMMGTQQGNPQMTKAEFQRRVADAVRGMGVWVFAEIRRRKAKAEEMFRLILRHYPQMEAFKADAEGLRRFAAKGMDGTETEVEFGEMPTDRNAILKMKRGLYTDRKASLAGGVARKRIRFDPVAAKDLKWIFNMRVVPKRLASKDMDIEDAERKATLYANLGMNPEAVQKQLLRAEGDDPEQFAAKPQPPPQPPQGSPPQAQNQPVQPSQPVQGQKTPLAGNVPPQGGLTPMAR